MSRWSHQQPGEFVILDNRDSFVFNLAHRLWEVGVRKIVVVRSDEIDVQTLDSWRPAALVVSPGPGHPDDAGCSIEAIRHFSGRIPILGVCLGHQAIAVAFGGLVGRSEAPTHGRASLCEHRGTGLLAGLESPVPVGRYHSLVAREPVPAELEVDGYTDGFVMAFHHAQEPTFGVQFHPESVLTPDGTTILANFVRVVRARQ